MFFHGIDYEYLIYQYPILNPLKLKTKQSIEQKLDSKHLIEIYGFEPVHFLKSSKEYPAKRCIEECFKFGNVVLVYKTLKYPLLQLSANEVGVTTIDSRNANFFIVRDSTFVNKLRKIFPHIPTYMH